MAVAGYLYFLLLFYNPANMEAIKYTKFFFGSVKERDLFGRPTRGSEDNIKMDFV
jgi:hypothetical protein